MPFVETLRASPLVESSVKSRQGILQPTRVQGFSVLKYVRVEMCFMEEPGSSYQTQSTDRHKRELVSDGWTDHVKARAFCTITRDRQIPSVDRYCR